MRNLVNASERVLEAASEQPIRPLPRQAPQSDRAYMQWAREQGRRRTVLNRKVARAMKGAQS
jgi:hypothetical protein